MIMMIIMNNYVVDLDMMMMMMMVVVVVVVADMHINPCANRPLPDYDAPCKCRRSCYTERTCFEYCIWANGSKILY
jgi:hypothetical protein